MQTYLVEWQIEIDGADNPRHAAEVALEVMSDPHHIATVFSVWGPDGNRITIDLEREEP